MEAQYVWWALLTVGIIWGVWTIFVIAMVLDFVPTIKRYKK